jgi:hypothetical protein
MTHAHKLGLEGIGIEAPWLALPLRPLATLGEEQEPGGTSGQARSGGGLGQKRNGDNAGQDAICVWDGRTDHFAHRRASSSRSMQKSEEHL